jgi:hypothetical protein
MGWKLPINLRLLNFFLNIKVASDNYFQTPIA